MHTTIPAPPPYAASLNAITGQAGVRFVGEVIQAEALSPALLAVGNVLDRLDSGAGLVAALKQAAELNAKVLFHLDRP